MRLAILTLQPVISEPGPVQGRVISRLRACLAKLRRRLSPPGALFFHQRANRVPSLLMTTDRYRAGHASPYSNLHVRDSAQRSCGSQHRAMMPSTSSGRSHNIAGTVITLHEQYSSCVVSVRCQARRRDVVSLERMWWPEESSALPGAFPKRAPSPCLFQRPGSFLFQQRLFAKLPILHCNSIIKSRDTEDEYTGDNFLQNRCITCLTWLSKDVSQMAKHAAT